LPKRLGISLPAERSSSSQEGSSPLHEIVRVISKEADYGGVEWVQLAQDRNKWKPLPQRKDGDFSIGQTSANVK
jgi:hypothetical protein